MAKDSSVTKRFFPMTGCGQDSNQQTGLPPTGYTRSGRGTFAGLLRNGHEERGETSKRAASWVIRRTFRSRFRERIPDTSPWLVISDKSDCSNACSSMNAWRITEADESEKGTWVVKRGYA